MRIPSTNHFLILLLTLLITSLPGYSQKKIWDETPEEKKERMAWWTEARFGMFIHWGLYAQPARHEWVKQRERMDNDAYRNYYAWSAAGNG